MNKEQFKELFKELIEDGTIEILPAVRNKGSLRVPSIMVFIDGEFVKEFE